MRDNRHKNTPAALHRHRFAYPEGRTEKIVYILTMKRESRAADEIDARAKSRWTRRCNDLPLSRFCDRDPDDDGRRWMAARWFNERGERGDWETLVIQI